MNAAQLLLALRRETRNRAYVRRLEMLDESQTMLCGGMKMSDRAFRCYTFRSGQDYYAECLDLGLLTKRQTAQAAMDSLNEAILCHLEAAYSRGWEKDLVPRRAPLARWLRFYASLVWHTAKALVSGRVDGLIAYELRQQVAQPLGLSYA